MRAGATALVLACASLPCIARAAPSDVVVVVEDSQAARQADPDGSRWQAVDVARQMLLPDDRLGVVAAGAGGRLTRPLSHPDPLEGPIRPSGGGFRGAGGANPLSGIRRALDALEADRREGASPSMVVVLVSEPTKPAATAVQEVIERAHQVGAAVHGIRTSDSPGPTFLEEIAAATGGSTQRTRRQGQLPLMFQTLFDRLLPDRGTELSDGRLPVDATVKSARLVVETDDPKSVHLVRPDGERLRAGQNGEGVGWLQGDDVAMVSIVRPDAGTWRIDARPGATVRAWVESDLRLRASLGEDRVEPGAAVPVTAFLEHNGRRVPRRSLPAGLSISAAIPSTPSAKARPLIDDGTEGDETADDGLFRTTLAAPGTPGVHDVAVQATAPGFYRRVVVPLLVMLKGREPIPDPPKKDDPGLAGAGGGQAPAPVLADLPPAALGLVVLLLALATFMLVVLLRRRARAVAAAGPSARVPKRGAVGFARIRALEQGEIDNVVEGYLSFVGRTLPDAADSMPLEGRVILIADRNGEFTERIQEQLGGVLHFERVMDAEEARERLGEEPPELLILVDPFVGDTIRAFIRWMTEEAGLGWLPVVRVVDEPTRKGVIDELRSGALDVLATSSAGSDLLRRVARAISAGEKRMAGEKKRSKRRGGPPARSEPEPVEVEQEEDFAFGLDDEPEPAEPAEPSPAARGEKQPARPRYGSGDDFEWVSDRLDRLPLPLRIIGPDGDAEGVLVDVGFEGFAVAARSPTGEGTGCEFESDLFVSLALDRVHGKVVRCLAVGAEEYPYLWEVDYEALDQVHRKRIENCYWGLVNSL